MKHVMLLAALGATLVLAAGGCASTGTPGSAAGTRAPGADADTGGVPAAGGLSVAGSALLLQSRNERRSGDYARAAATLERALRVEPTASAIWLELARVRLLEGNFAQAEQLARKAESLAEGGSALAAESRAVVVEALQRQGRGSEADALPSGSGS